jgi:choline dehydrogenase-like flavoprotein
MDTDFIVVGSGGGGGTIAWLLAKAGFTVELLEQGPDIAENLYRQSVQYNPFPHDEHRFRVDRPAGHRRPRGDYNTFRSTADARAQPFAGGWTSSVFGGGSVGWGAWSTRALPIDYQLRTHFKATGQLATLEQEWGYSIPDWPVSYSEMEPFYNVSDALLAVNGDRQAVNESIYASGWYQAFAAEDYFQQAGNWAPDFPFPSPPYPRTPVGEFVACGARAAGLHPVSAPSGMVAPGSSSYSTRRAIKDALEGWGSQPRPTFWTQAADEIWSTRVRDACNLCGFCGEYLCWGQRGPKSGSRASMLREIEDLPTAEFTTHARVFEITYDEVTKRATGVRYLDVRDPDSPRVITKRARHVIVSCGAVQSARLLLLSGPPQGLGNAHDQVGRYATFHLFGLNATCFLPAEFQGSLRAELGHTGNTIMFDHYFVRDDRPDLPTSGLWWKSGTIVSTAKKNPLDNGDNKIKGGLIGRDLITAMERYNRSVELRLTADDLPRAITRVDLDPTYVDEYGLPVARITRNLGEHEELVFTLMSPKLEAVFQHFRDVGVLRDQPGTPAVVVNKTNPALIGDHQHGTCRMGEDPATSVVDRFCRLHDVPNVFVVDTSFFPTGFGLNPMVTIVANALRVGSWIVDQARHGDQLTG